MFLRGHKVEDPTFGRGIVKEVVENKVIVNFNNQFQTYTIDGRNTIFKEMKTNPTLTNLEFKPNIGEVIEVRQNEKDSWRTAYFVEFIFGNKVVARSSKIRKTSVWNLYRVKS